MRVILLNLYFNLNFMQIVVEEFLEDINNILNSGEVLIIFLFIRLLFSSFVIQ